MLLPSVRPNGPGERLSSVTWRRAGDGLGAPFDAPAMREARRLGCLRVVRMGEIERNVVADAAGADDGDAVAEADLAGQGRIVGDDARVVRAGQVQTRAGIRRWR